jgi:hypothetical protein
MMGCSPSRQVGVVAMRQACLRFDGIASLDPGFEAPQDRRDMGKAVLQEYKRRTGAALFG